MSLQSLFIITGEPSGDLHGGHLVNSLRQIDPHMDIKGVAGPKMRAAGITGPLSMEDFRVMGFTDVIKALPKLYKQFYLLADYIMDKLPNYVVFVDYPGFNLRLAKHLRKRGYQGKLIHYVCPSVWAWGKKRIPLMAKNLDLLLTIFPFEAAYFSQTLLDVQYVGNPLCDYIASYSYNKTWKSALSIPEDATLIGIFPGSRIEEIKRNLPFMLETAHVFLKEHQNAHFAISCSSEHSEAIIREMIKTKSPEDSTHISYVPKEWAYELMQSCHCAIAKSGTVTLELALHYVPTVVIYKLTPFNRFIAKRIIGLNLPYYCIVNILAKNETFPELIDQETTSEALTPLLRELYNDTKKRQQCIQACKELHTLLSTKSLGNESTSFHAAQAILEVH